MAAVDGVAAGAVRHVLVYRTVKMMGGAIVDPDSGAGSGSGAARRPGRRPTRASSATWPHC